MNDDNLALRFGWAQRYRAARCQGHLPSLPDTSKARTRTTSLPPRKRSAARFDPSEPSETFSGVFWSFPTPRKRSAACFEAFRGLGNVQRRVLMLSEASEMFSGVFWSFPTRRKRSAARFDAFRRVGNVQRRVLTFSEASDGGQTCAAGRSPPIPPIFAAGYLVYGCVASYPIPCLTTTYYSEITLTTTYNGITVWNRRASQCGEVDLV